jgi:hypothetical protein
LGRRTSAARDSVAHESAARATRLIERILKDRRFYSEVVVSRKGSRRPTTSVRNGVSIFTIGYDYKCQTINTGFPCLTTIRVDDKTHPRQILSRYVRVSEDDPITTDRFIVFFRTIKNEWMGNRRNSPRVCFKRVYRLSKERGVDVTIDQGVLNHGSVAYDFEL